MTYKNLIFALFLSLNAILAQSEREFGTSLNYILSANVFPNIISSDAGVRNLSNELNSWFGISADLRHRIKNGYFLGASFEIVNKKVDGFLTRTISNRLVKIPVEDRYKIYIVELSAFFVAPFSSEKWEVYIGGGLGAYKGNFTKRIHDIESKVTKSPITIGIQVMSGVKRNFSKNPGLRAEIKFRDPIVDVESQFKSNTINYNGYIISVDPTPFKTRVNFDTITFILSIVYSF